MVVWYARGLPLIMRLRMSLVEGHEAAPESAREWVFDERGGVIGRSADCAWRLECPRKLVSRRHAQVVFEGGEFFVYDASANGLFHNGATEPVGIGQRVRLQDGDSLRLGDYVVTVALESAGADGSGRIDCAANVAAAPTEPVEEGASIPVQPSLSPQALGEWGPPPVVASEPQPESLAPEVIAGTDLGNSNDQFQPPAALIPEEWDKVVEDGAPANTEPHDVLVEPLGEPREAQAEVAKALWAALRLTADETPLTPALARDLGRCLRLSLHAAFRFKIELDLAEQRLTGKAPSAASGAAGVLEDYPDAGAFLTALAEEPDATKRQRLLLALGDVLTGLQSRHEKLSSGVQDAVTQVAEQFAPEEIEQRYAQFIADRGYETWFERFLRRRNPGAVYWGFYRSWFAGQRRAGFLTLAASFQRKLSGLGLSRR